VIINESAIHAFGFDSPEKAIQQKLVLGDGQKTIVGVVENFNWHSLKEPHVPYVISLTNVRQNPYLSIKMSMSDITQSLAQIESTFRTFYPDQPFEYFFADDTFNRQYQSEVQFGKIFFSFAALAILIACVGLFSLVSFSATLRVKEIGIRKVLGADVRHLVLLLSREYAVLVSLATLIAIPVIWYWGSLWLSNYATRIHIGVDLFVVPVIILIVIAALTVSQKTFTTARANPVDSLRKE
jgi:putative ABC transport system permease protein